MENILGATRRYPQKPEKTRIPQCYFEESTMHESYKWPKTLKTRPKTLVNPNTQTSQVECLLSSKSVMEFGGTTYEEDYFRHSIPRSKTAFVPRTKILEEPLFFEKTTTYNEMNRPVIRAFRRNEVKRVLSLKPIEKKQIVPSFGYSSTYQDAFSKKTITLETYSTPVAITNAVPFRGKSTMRSDYNFKIHPPSALPKKEKLRSEPENRDFKTTYRSCYKRPPYPLPSPFAIWVRPWTCKCN
ncbi:hypothetical protein TcCL_NonESM05207 [Trypanosoma cruzi]|nr:hypothetical protein TcCL_NonESM05207 [Trypanosoma cruzi]